MNTIIGALELARDGHHRDLNAIRRTLAVEGYEQVHSHLHGRSICKTIKDAIKATPLAEGAIEPQAKRSKLHLRS